ncbi:MAG: hypothetical protein H0T95_11195 [Chthoniobacterales bacterium]|nr:hypothetical protein [Chthoniobacterales bacterium]
MSAVLLGDSNLRDEDNRIGKILDFFAVEWRAAALPAVHTDVSEDGLASRPIRLLGSAQVFCELLEQLEHSPQLRKWWSERVHSAFVYAARDSGALQLLLRRLTTCAPISKRTTQDKEFAVTEEWNEFCAAMSGVRTRLPPESITPSMVLDTTEGGLPIISSAQGAAFIMLEYHGVRIFLSTSEEIVDLDSAIQVGNFDIRDYFLAAVPLVLYVNWAFKGESWKTPEIGACVIIDDPLIRPRYGFINFRKLVGLINHHRITASLAFIPWNWRRTDPNTARLFRDGARMSLSVHGCDHTRREFGTSDSQVVASKVKRAVERMESHETRSGIKFDRVMVFPQGVFSECSISVLKQYNFLAAINTGMISSDAEPRTIRLRDLWEPALMAYGEFPIFSRRSPAAGLENFAFDMLLGKPCLIVTHHDFFGDGCRRFVDFVAGLKAINCPLVWRSPAALVRRTFRQRELSSGEIEAEMFTRELIIENHFDRRTRYLIKKRESCSSRVSSVWHDAEHLEWTYSDGYVRFSVELEPKQTTTVSIDLHEGSREVASESQWAERAKVALRRLLSEARDNYYHPIRAWSPFRK